MKIFKTLFLALTSLSMAILPSCSSIEDMTAVNQSNKTGNLPIVSATELISICEEVSDLCEANEEATRAFEGSNEIAAMNATTATSIQHATQPLRESGTAYRDMMVTSYNTALKANAILQENLLTAEELEVLNDLSEEELTFIGMQLSILSDAYDKATIDDNSELKISLDSFIKDSHVECFIKAIGLDDAGVLIEGLAGLLDGGGNIFKVLLSGEAYLNAKTMSQLLRAMGVKYLG